MKYLVLFMLTLFSVSSSVYAQSPEPRTNQEVALEVIEKKLESLENDTKTGIDRLENRIDGVSNGILSQILIPLLLAAISFFLGYWNTKYQMRIVTDAKIKEWLDKIVPEQCDIALKEYLKNRFPGNLEFLMAAARYIAYDQELKQTKRLRVIGMDQKLSQKVLDQLRFNSLLQVEFIPFKEGMALPTADLILIDRISCLNSPKPMEEDHVRDLIKEAKASDQNPCVHYFGKMIVGLPEIINEKHAFSNAPFSLVPNLMDQLRFAFPQTIKIVP